MAKVIGIDISERILDVARHTRAPMGRDYKTTEISADFAPDPSQGAMWAQRAFGGAGGPHPAALSAVNEPPPPSEE